MERIGVRELRQHASRYLDKVKAGETVEVTDRGQLVALIVPPAPGTTAREALIASGGLIPASGPLRAPARATVTADSGEILRGLREER